MSAKDVHAFSHSLASDMNEQQGFSMGMSPNLIARAKLLSSCYQLFKWTISSFFGLLNRCCRTFSLGFVLRDKVDVPAAKLL